MNVPLSLAGSAVGTSMMKHPDTTLMPGLVLMI
jgi:hypothetical protein